MVLSLSVRSLFVVLFVCMPLWCQAETVLLDFSSPTCGPCRQMRPTIARLASEGLLIREIDISRDPQTAARYGVKQVPTFIVAVDGRAAEQKIGPTSYDQLRAMLTRHMPASSQPIASTFAAQPTSPAADLSRPQAGRVVSLQDPTPRPPRPSAIPNTFGNTQSRPQTPATGSLSSHHQRLLSATVKITVDDPDGKSVGTGTIVDARSGEALVLTCGHLFRSSQGQGQITVTTFQPSAAGATPGPAYVGKLIDYDLDRDLALLSMWPTSPVQAVAVADKQVAALAPQAPVTSVGCNHGHNPTVRDSRVTSIDRYEGTPNVEVAGAPVEGRSGGGLFNTSGQLVGVCYAADPQGNEGLYAGLPSIHAKLDSLKLSMIYAPNAVPPRVAPAAVAVDVQPRAPLQPAPPVTSIRGQEPEAAAFASTAAPIAPQPSQAASSALPPAEQAALEEITRRGINSEVICIIRPQDPTAKSEVITLNNVSPGFVSALANPAGQDRVASPIARQAAIAPNGPLAR
ncbi:MAG: trypsin-like peptidase domain-containing protein [Planctomycetota bacterium]